MNLCESRHLFVIDLCSEAFVLFPFNQFFRLIIFSLFPSWISAIFFIYDILVVSKIEITTTLHNFFFLFFIILFFVVAENGVCVSC
jgi:hypothetical protein